MMVLHLVVQSFKNLLWNFITFPSFIFSIISSILIHGLPGYLRVVRGSILLRKDMIFDLIWFLLRLMTDTETSDDFTAEELERMLNKKLKKKKKLDGIEDQDNNDTGNEQGSVVHKWFR